MWMEDGFSYTKSEQEEGDDNRPERPSIASSTEDSSSDDLSDEDLNKTAREAEKARRRIQNRMEYYKKHVDVLKVDAGKINDPVRLKMFLSGGSPDPEERQSGKKHSLPSSSLSKHYSLDEESRRKSAPLPKPHISQSARSVSAGDFHSALERVVNSKDNEDLDKKLMQFHRIRMKKLLTIEKLEDYLKMLQTKQQQRLMEEHRSTFRKFTYSGPSREGPLFCLREKYRRERKAWRVKFAKKYGLLCSQVRLEKRLMRKARRLLLREKILNALKDKMRCKVIVLFEMKHEFKKLIDKLKLNKEIQEKINRQDRLSKNELGRGGKKPEKKKKSKSIPNASSKHTSKKAPILESSELQKSSRISVYRGVSDISGFSKLTPLPSAPSSQKSTTILPHINKTSRSGCSLPKIAAVNVSTAWHRCPPLVQDKKLGTARSMSGFSSSPCIAALPLPKAKEVKSSGSVELPLINDTRYGLRGFDGKHKSIPSDSRTRKYQMAMMDRKRTIESLAAKKSHGGLGSSPIRYNTDVHIHNDPTTRPRHTKNSHQTAQKGKLVRNVEAPNWPQGTVIPCPTLAGGYVRRSAIHPVPRNKYRTRDIFWHGNRGLDVFIAHYKRALEEQLTSAFGSNRSENFLQKIVTDVKKMSEFVLDHLHQLPLKDLDFIMGKLMDLKDDPRFTSFKHYLTNIHETGNGIQHRIGPHRNEFRSRINAMSDRLKAEFRDFRTQQFARRKEFRALKTIRRGRNFKRIAVEETVTTKKKQKKRRKLADKLLLARTDRFNNPVRVTTKLGGRLMLQGWRHMPFEEYVNLGAKLHVYKSGWRKDGMGSYEVMAPYQPIDGLKYLLILNRLDLTPRRFIYPGYRYDGDALRKYKYASGFYRQYLLKRGERKTDRGKQRTSFQQGATINSKPRMFIGEHSASLLEGQYRVPHMRHRIFTMPSHLLQRDKPSDKNTPLMFARREETPAFIEDSPKKFRIHLQETQTIDLFYYESTVAVRGTKEAIEYTSDLMRKKKYERMYHRTFSRETQTELLNFIERGTQAYASVRDSKKTNVHETDIVQASIEPSLPKIASVRIPGFQADDVSDPSDEGSASTDESVSDETTKILTSREFAGKAKMTLRIMDSQLYSKAQSLFLQGIQMDPLDPKAEISYSHERLFTFIDKRLALSEYVVTCMDWSSVNANLLAVGYSRHPLYPEQDKGLICIWNVKLISKYERKFEFKSGVTHLQFCQPYPRLLNVALIDGSVLILDLGAKKNFVITTKLSSVFSDYKPVWQFSWIQIEADKWIPVTCGDNGFIHQLRPDGTFQHSKFLSLGHREGKVKGINVSSSMGLKPRLRGRPGITCMEKHPTDPVLYLVGTTDGCVHHCSIHFRNQHLDVFSAHIGAVKGIQFHPHCEHVFLTFGEDFYVRVWVYGVYEPALELMGGHYYVRAARWSPSNSEILVSISNKFVDVWDIRRKTDAPIHRFTTPRGVENTALIFDSSGRNIVLGNIHGDVYVYALTNMPFSHHFKGEAVANALEKVLKSKKKFVRDLKKVGYPFGASSKEPSSPTN